MLVDEDPSPSVVLDTTLDQLKEQFMKWQADELDMYKLVLKSDQSILPEFDKWVKPRIESMNELRDQLGDLFK